MCFDEQAHHRTAAAKSAFNAVAEQYFEHLEGMDEPTQATWRERLEARLKVTEERLAAWSSRAHAPHATKTSNSKRL